MNETPLRITCAIGPYLPVPPLLGGAVERIFLALSQEFARRGHQVTLISRRFPGLANDETVGAVRFLRIASRDAPANRILYRLFDLVYAIRVCLALPAADVTITHSVSLPVILPRRRAGKIYVSVARFPKNQMGLYRRADRLQAVSTTVARAIARQTPAVAHLVRTVPNALSEAFCAAFTQTAAPREREILFVGRIAREKGIDILIRAFKAIADKHPGWRLVVIGPSATGQGGDGTALLAQLQQLVPELRSRIDFVGPIFDETLLVARYLRAEIFAYPSVAAQGESFGLAPLEAMACGCAVVTSSLECFGDFLRPEHNGLQFDHADDSGKTLAMQLDRLMADTELRRRLAAEARRTAQDYTPERVAALFLEDFRRLLVPQG